MIIEIHPYDINEYEAGLGNKLRTIFSFCNYCEINKFKLKVKWNYFYKLFPNISNDRDLDGNLIEPIFVSAEHGDGLPDLF